MSQPEVRVVAPLTTPRITVKTVSRGPAIGQTLPDTISLVSDGGTITVMAIPTSPSPRLAINSVNGGASVVDRTVPDAIAVSVQNVNLRLQMAALEQQILILGQAIEQIEVGAAALSRLDRFFATAGQTVFTLSHTATQPHLSTLYLNGVKASYGLEYVINTSLLTWLSSVRLEPADAIEIYYI